MMPEDVRKAVDTWAGTYNVTLHAAAKRALVAHLLDREAEADRLQAHANAHRDGRLRALEMLAKSDALLRACLNAIRDYLPDSPSDVAFDILEKDITAHLSENSR